MSIYQTNTKIVLKIKAIFLLLLNTKRKVKLKWIFYCYFTFRIDLVT